MLSMALPLPHLHPSPRNSTGAPHRNLTSQPQWPTVPRSGSNGNLPNAIRCGLRGAGTRKPLWRSSVLSGEAIQAVQALKLANKVPPRPSDHVGISKEDVFRIRVSRLLKADLVAVLAELQRQNEWELSLQVFDYIRKEEWYQPDLSLYSDMIYMAGKNKSVDVAEALFSEIKKDGLQPDSRAYSEMIGIFLQIGMLEKAMEMYSSMKESGCRPNELTFTILIRNLEKMGEHNLAASIKKDCEEFLEYPEKFLKEVSKTFSKRRKLKLI